MEDRTITAVGIDVSKGKSTVAVRRPGGEVVLTPFLVEHDAAGLSSLVKTLRSVGGNIRIVMEHTGMYWRLIALVLKEAGFFISVVLHNGLISLLDQTFPGVNMLFDIQRAFQVGRFRKTLLAQGLCGGHFLRRVLGRLPQMVRQIRLSLLPA